MQMGCFRDFSSKPLKRSTKHVQIPTFKDLKSVAKAEKKTNPSCQIPGFRSGAWNRANVLQTNSQEKIKTSSQVILFLSKCIF